MDEQIKTASKFFYDLILSNEKRLANGFKDRERLKTQIANGQKPTGYRAEWLSKSSIKVITYLAELAKDFNKTYDYDKISVDDLLDVLQNAINKIEKQHRKNNEDDL